MYRCKWYQNTSLRTRQVTLHGSWENNWTQYEQPVIVDGGDFKGVLVDGGFQRCPGWWRGFQRCPGWWGGFQMGPGWWGISKGSWLKGGFQRGPGWWEFQRVPVIYVERAFLCLSVLLFCALWEHPLVPLILCM